VEFEAGFAEKSALRPELDAIPTFDLLRRPIQDAVDVGAFSATLPTQ